MRRPFNGAVNITQEYGAIEEGSRRGYHTGVDYGMPVGSDVVSPTNGTLHQNGDGRAASDGRGFFVTIVGDDGVGHCLYHLSQNGIVSTGSRVTEGQLVGKSGNTGQSTGPHLHWETRNSVDDQNSDFAPANWLFGAAPTSAPSTQLHVKLEGDYRTIRSTPGGTAIGKIAPNSFGGTLDYEVLERNGDWTKIHTQSFGDGWTLTSGPSVDSLTQFYNA